MVSCISNKKTKPWLRKDCRSTELNKCLIYLKCTQYRCRLLFQIWCNEMFTAKWFKIKNSFTVFFLLSARTHDDKVIESDARLWCRFLPNNSQTRPSALQVSWQYILTASWLWCCFCRVLWSSGRLYPEHWERWQPPFLLEGNVHSHSTVCSHAPCFVLLNLCTASKTQFITMFPFSTFNVHFS